MAQLKINRGTTYTIGLTYNRDGVPATLVGATVRFTIKTTEFDQDMTDSDALVLKNVTDGTVDGQATISLEPEDTKEIEPGKYYYDIKVDLPSGKYLSLMRVQSSWTVAQRTEGLNE